MEEKKLFMVRTYEMRLKGYGKHMAEVLGVYFPEWYDGELVASTFDEYIPFKKTDNNEKEEYVEMITGTIYHKEDDRYVSEDSLVSFTNIHNYDEYWFGFLCEEHSLLLTKLAMKLVYRNNRKLVRKERNAMPLDERGNKVLKKLERKHKNKLTGRN